MSDAQHPDTPRNRGLDDVPHLSPATPAEDARTILINPISRSAVLVGMALVTQFVLKARERAAQALAKAQIIPVEQGRTLVQGYEQQFRQTVDTAKRQATEAADAAARAAPRGALFGAIAGGFGGRMGAVDPTLTRGTLRTTPRAS